MKNLLLGFTLLASMSSLASIHSETPLDCQGNVNFKRLQNCARMKGIKIQNGGGGSNSVSDYRADIMSPIIMSCLNTYFFLTKKSKDKRIISNITLIDFAYGRKPSFLVFPQPDGSVRLTIPAKTETIYMEEVIGNHHVMYEQQTLGMDDCVEHLMKNGIH